VTLETVGLAKLGVMAAAVVGLFLVLALSGDARAQRRLDWGLAALAVLALFCYSQFGLFHKPGLIHASDMFHYYLSSQYWDELGYDGLYGAALAADAEQPRPYWADLPRARDLRSYRVLPATSLRADPSFRARFSDERWEAFKRDVAFFQPLAPQREWRRFLTDHGYNAPPSRTFLTAWLTAAAGRATAASLHAIALADALLLALLIGGVFRVYGLRTSALVTILLGTNELAAYYWTGGSLLRNDWLVLTGLGLCALEARRSALAGGLLAAAALLRGFPALFIVGVLLRGGWVLWTTGRWERRYTEFAGAVCAVGILFALGSLTLGEGLAPWSAFLAKIQLHVEPQFHNHVGLRALLDGPGLWLGRAVALGAFLWLVPRVSDVQAALLGGLLVFGLMFLACYYYAFLALWMLWQRDVAQDLGGLLGYVLLILPSAAVIVAGDLPHQVQFRIASAALSLACAALVAQVARRPLQPALRPVE
jgi:hypothetical protein